MNRYKIILIILMTAGLSQGQRAYAGPFGWPKAAITGLASICGYCWYKGLATTQRLLGYDQQQAIMAPIAKLPTQHPAMDEITDEPAAQDAPVAHEPTICQEITDTLQLLPALQEGAFGYLHAKVLPADSHIINIGDLHGDKQSLQNDIDHIKELGILDQNLRLKEHHHLIFTGDLADRGLAGIPVWQTVMRLIKINPAQVHIIRGNHETYDVAHFYGFHRELKINFGDQAELVWQAFNQLFDRLPSAIFFGMRNATTQKIEYAKYCHGGIEKRLNKHIYNMLAQATQNGKATCTFTLADLDNGKCALNWGDFHATCHTDKDEHIAEREIKDVLTHNHAFVADYLHQFDTQDHSVICIIRGHQHISGGVAQLKDKGDSYNAFEPMANKQPQLITQGSVFTLISSPGGLGGDCREDAFAIVENTHNGLLLTPHIWQRY